MNTLLVKEKIKTQLKEKIKTQLMYH